MGVLKRKQESEAITFKLPAALKREIDQLRSRARFSSSRTARLRNRRTSTETTECTSLSMPATLRPRIPKLQTFRPLSEFSVGTTKVPLKDPGSPSYIG
jgi:hypothetical protein